MTMKEERERIGRTYRAGGGLEGWGVGILTLGVCKGFLLPRQYLVTVSYGEEMSCFYISEKPCLVLSSPFIRTVMKMEPRGLIPF